MKLAVILFGQARNYNECYKSLLNYIKNYDNDIFITTWNTCPNDIEISNAKVNGGNDKKYIYKNIDKLDIQKKYKPKVFELIDEVKYNENEKKLSIEETNKGYHNYIRQWYSKFISFLNFKKYCNDNNKTYDFILLIRFDLYFFNNILDLQGLNNNFLYHNYKNNLFMGNKTEANGLSNINSLNIYNYTKKIFINDIISKNIILKDEKFFKSLKYKLNNNIFDDLNNKPFNSVIEHSNCYYLSKSENIEKICYAFVIYYILQKNKKNVFYKKNITDLNWRIKAEIFSSNLFNIKKRILNETELFTIYRFK